MSKSNLIPAVFLDRDGTINVERGYITDPEAVELYSGVADVIRELNLRGYLIVIVSNQSAIGRHLMDEEQFARVNYRLWTLLRKSDARYDALYYCPHSRDAQAPCECRKPKPGLILQAANDLRIDVAASFFVGDKILDIQAGQAAGCKTIMVLTGNGRTSVNMFENAGIKPDSVQENLAGASAYISAFGNR